MKILLALAAAAELLTGILLVAFSEAVVKLLLQAEVVGAGLVLTRFAGIALIALGIGCWPVGSDWRSATRGLFAYNFLITILLLFVGIGRELVGVLLWPAFALHTLLSILLGVGIFRKGRS